MKIVSIQAEEKKGFVENFIPGIASKHCIVERREQNFV